MADSDANETVKETQQKISEQANKYLGNSDVKKKRGIVLAVTAVVILAIIGFVFFANNDSSGTNDNTDGGVNATFPTGVTAERPGWVANTAEVPSPVNKFELFEDFQCPACELFETSYGEQVRFLANNNNASFTYFPMSFLDASLRNTSSAEATNAFGCAIDQGFGQQYHDVLFANHPKPEGVGWTTTQLKSFGETAGLTGDSFSEFEKCVNDQPYIKWGSAVNIYAANREGVQGTPTFKVNGVEVPRDAFSSPEALEQKIQEILTQTNSGE